MADNAPTTGARARAPRNSGGDVSPSNNLDQTLANARAIVVGTEAIEIADMQAGKAGAA